MAAVTINLAPHWRNLLEDVVRPTLRHLAQAELPLHSPTAERLLLGTALIESWGIHIRQHRGPALGIYQMEPATHAWLVDDVIPRYPRLQRRIDDIQGSMPQNTYADMIGNLYYATALARMRYWPVPAALPEPSDDFGIASYWKDGYNSHLGAGTVAGFLSRYVPYVKPLFA